MEHEDRHLIPLFIEEAPTIIPDQSNEQARNRISLDILERVAREGRKYGLTLAPVSQSPSELSDIVRKQVHNTLSLRLTQDQDKRVIGNMPGCEDCLSDMLPILDDREAILFGDAVELPGRSRSLCRNTRQAAGRSR